MRLAAYGAFSTSLATAVILAAFQQRPNFYSACVYLSQSNACLMILTNMGVFLTILLGVSVQKLFFGHLRAIEEAHLRERTWFAVTETFLAMTVFRDEFNTRFVVMFVSLLFVKCFHWICQDRIDYMEQFPTIPLLFHVRMVSAMLLFLGADIAFISHAIDVTIRHGASMMIMFGFEFILLAATITAVFVKYILNVIDSRHTEAWENRSIYMFYLELATDFFKLLTYLAFFSIILTYYGLPLHIIRDVYITLRSFAKKLMSFIRYRQATAHMNERYPDATVEELEATGDRTCIICREQMVHGGEAGRERTRPKKLRCGHILHFHCLRSWLERQQSCPTCRRPVLEEPPTRPPPARIPIIPPPPPMPGAAPVPFPLPNFAIPAAGAAPPQPPPPAPGPTPAPFPPRTMPRIVAGGQITLPPGYALPPGWAVIPAQNVQIIPPATAPPQPPPPTQPPQNVGQSASAAPAGATQQGPSPVPAGSPIGGSGDVTIPAPAPNDHVSDQSDATNTGTNIPATTSVHPTTQPQSPATEQPTQQTSWTNNIPNNNMQRTAPRVWATQSPHPSFPIAVPLFPTAGNMGTQYRSPGFAATNVARTDGISSRMGSQGARVNGDSTSEGRRDTEDHVALLNQMGESVRTMQELVARMSVLIPPQPPTISPTNQAHSLPSPSNSFRQPSISEPSTSNGQSSDPKSSRNPSPLIIRKRRSFSPNDRHNDTEPHPNDRLSRLSSEEEVVSPEEIADIRAPWVDQTLDPFDPDLPPLPEVGRSRQGSLSPPRLRSGSQSPHRSLVRRGSMLKHDITSEVLEERLTEASAMEVDRDRKGKGKEVYVEDGSDEE